MRDRDETSLVVREGNLIAYINLQGIHATVIGIPQQVRNGVPEEIDGLLWQAARMEIGGR